MQKRVKTEVDSLRKELHASVSSSLVALQNKVKELSKQNDELEQYSRHSCLRVSGIVETDNGNVKEVVLDLAELFGVDIIPQDIDRAYRTDKPRTQMQSSSCTGHKKQNNGPEIIIKFTNSAAQLNLLKNQTARIYINKDLTSG